MRRRGRQLDTHGDALKFTANATAPALLDAWGSDWGSLLPSVRGCPQRQLDEMSLVESARALPKAAQSLDEVEAQLVKGREGCFDESGTLVPADLLETHGTQRHRLELVGCVRESLKRRRELSATMRELLARLPMRSLPVLLVQRELALRHRDRDLP
jgi:hypothetical protein